MPSHPSARFGLAAALLSHVCLAIVWMGWARWWWAFLPVVAVLAWLAAPMAVSWVRRPVALLALSPYLILYALHALAAERQPDALTYHLQAVAEWLRTGGFVSRAGFFDVIPHGMETLYTAAAAVGGGFAAAKVLHLLFLGATVPLMLTVANGLGFDGAPAAALYFMAPVVAVTATSAYNDAAAAFYVLLVFHLLERGNAAWAGVAAGFCYAIKMSGAVVPVAVVLWLLFARRDRRGALLAAAASAAMMAPWMIRAWLWAGHPLAPMAPSPYFYPEPLAAWHEYVRSYGVAWSERWWEITLGGARANGLTGPAFLLAPIGLLALRKPGGWTLWTAAAVSLLPWLFNAGTRFLMPAMIFIALAVVWTLPKPAAWALVAAQAVLCWPGVIQRWTPPGSWYLSSVVPPPVDFPMAAMINRHVKAGENVLDLLEAPRSLVQANMLVHWQHASAFRAQDALRAAAMPGRELFYELRGSWPAQPVPSLHVELVTATRADEWSPDRWSIQEMTLLGAGGEALFPSSDWALSASHNAWDMPLIFDRNRISRWSPWQPRRAGMFVHVDLGATAPKLSGIRLLCRRDEAGPVVRVRGLVERLEPAAAMDLNERATAMRFVRREGFRWILALDNDVLTKSPGEWGLEFVERAGGAVLLRIPDPPPAPPR